MTSLPIDKASGSLSLADIPLPPPATTTNSNRTSSHDMNENHQDDDFSFQISPHDLKSDGLVSTTASAAGRISDPDPDRSRRVTCALKLWLSLLGVVVLLGIAIGIPLQNNQKHATSNNPSSSDAGPSLEEVVSYLTLHGVSSLQDLMQPNSPQNLALHWLTSGRDPAGSDSADEPQQDIIPLVIPTTGIATEDGYQFVIRYVLAVLYYSMGGSAWSKSTHFLSTNLHVCDWNGESYAFDSKVETGGVLCQDPQQPRKPTTLDFGKYICTKRL